MNDSDQGTVRRKNVIRRWFECALLYITARLGPGFYRLAGLDEAHIPLSKVLAFASLKAYNTAVHEVNDATFHRASQHKAIEKAVLTTYGIPTPHLLAYCDKVGGRAVGGMVATTAEEVANALETLSPGDRICLKQAHGWGGEGFRVVEIVEGPRSFFDLAKQEESSPQDYLRSLLEVSPEGFVVERYVNQHSFYAGLNASSINSFRILVWDRADAERQWLYAFLRIGRDGALVDNATSGAIICPVDAVKGTLEPGFLKYGKRERLQKHPDSGVQLAGVVAPDFEGAIAAAIESVRVFPGINFAGVDVAMSVDGPQILELNVWPDYAGFAYCQMPSKQYFTSLV